MLFDIEFIVSEQTYSDRQTDREKHTNKRLQSNSILFYALSLLPRFENNKRKKLLLLL